MKKRMKKAVVKPAIGAAAPSEALEGARRASANASDGALPANPEVAAVARRRQFSPSDKRRILAAADRCTRFGEIGALLRHEGIYSSHLSTWRKQRAAQGEAGLNAQRGRKADRAIAQAHHSAKLTREIERLRRQLRHAQLIIEVQKKVSCLLALQAGEDSSEESA